MGYYAFFQGQLLPSLPFDYPRVFQPLSLNRNQRPYYAFRAVSLLTQDLRTQSLSAFVQIFRIRSFSELGKAEAPRTHRELYPRYRKFKDALLKQISRKTSYTKFDWTFTPSHNSSQYIAHTRVRSSKLSLVNLIKASSLGFGSYFNNYCIFYTCYHYAYFYQIKLAIKIY